MEKQVKLEGILLFLTGLFAAFTLGYFLGRNSNHTVLTTSDAMVTVADLECAEDAVSEPEEETEPVKTESEQSVDAQPKSAQVNLNTATKEELETLPGIGPALAERILEQRKLLGGFREKSDICTVSGIGEKKYEAIESLITVR